MNDRIRNRFAYATLIDLGFDHENPEILLNVSMEKPVDWDAVDVDGDVICKRLDFVLTVEHVQIKKEDSAATESLGIHFIYDRVVKDRGVRGGLHVYVLGLRPTRNERGRECDRLALETVVREAREIRGRSWCADIGEVRICWRHAPKEITVVDNGAFMPEETRAIEAPRATDDEVARMCDAFDAFCDDVDPQAAGIIPLDECDIEYIRRLPPPVPRYASLLN